MTTSPDNGEVAAAAAGEPSKLRLKVTAGNAAGAELCIEDPLMIGRNEAGDGNLGEDLEISREHARLSRQEDGAWAIEDLGSTNGTFVNGRKIDKPALLFPGDEIAVGGTTLVVQLSATPPPEPTALPAQPTAPDAPATAEAKPAPAAAPRLSLRLEVDLEDGKAWIELDEQSERVTLVSEGGRWRLAPPD